VIAVKALTRASHVALLSGFASGCRFPDAFDYAHLSALLRVTWASSTGLNDL
jgi:hypothetical protein